MLNRYGRLPVHAVQSHLRCFWSRLYSTAGPVPSTSVFRQILENTSSAIDRKARQFLLPTEPAPQIQRYRPDVSVAAKQEEVGILFAEPKLIRKSQRKRSYQASNRGAKGRSNRAKTQATLTQLRQAIATSEAFRSCLVFTSLPRSDLQRITADEFSSFLELLARGRSSYGSTITSTTIQRFKIVRNRLLKLGEADKVHSPLLLVLVLIQKQDEIPGLVDMVVGMEDPYYDHGPAEVRDQRLRDYEQLVVQWVDQAFADISSSLSENNNYRALKQKVLAVLPFLKQYTRGQTLLTPNILHAYYSSVMAYQQDPLDKGSERMNVLYKINVPSTLLFRLASPFARALPQTYDLLIEQYLLQQDRRSARSMMLARKEAGHTPSIDLYLSMLRGYRSFEAHSNIIRSVQEDAQGLNLVGDVRILNAMIALYGYERNPTAAWDTFTTYFNLHPYLQTSPDALVSRPRPDSETFVRLLRACVTSGAESVRYAIKIRACLSALSDQIVVTRDLVVAEVEVQCALGELDTAFAMLQHQQDSSNPNPFAFTLRPMGQRYAVKTLGRMVALLFRSTLALKDPEAALKLLLHAKEKYGITPVNKDVLSYWINWCTSQSVPLDDKMIQQIKSLVPTEMDSIQVQRQVDMILVKQNVRRIVLDVTPLKPKKRSASAEDLEESKVNDQQLLPPEDSLGKTSDARLIGARMRQYAQFHSHNKALPGILWRTLQNSVLKAGLLPRTYHIQSILLAYLKTKKFMAAIWTLEKAAKRFKLRHLGVCYSMIRSHLAKQPDSARRRMLLFKLDSRARRLQIIWDKKGLRALARSHLNFGNTARSETILKHATELVEAPGLNGEGEGGNFQATLLSFDLYMRIFASQDRPSRALSAQEAMATYLVSKEGLGQPINVELLEKRLIRSLRLMRKGLATRLGKLRPSSESDSYVALLEKALKLGEQNLAGLKQANELKGRAKEALGLFLEEAVHTEEC